MLIWKSLVIASFAIQYAYGTLKPEDVDPGWLTLATSNTPTTLPLFHAGQAQSQHLSIENQQVEKSNQNVSQEVAPTLAEANLSSRRTTKYFKSAETRAKIKASWTPERKRRYAERMRMVNTGRKHTLEAKEKMRKKSKNRKTEVLPFTTKQKISVAMFKYHALKKANKWNDW